jgi:hypothetical protein
MTVSTRVNRLFLPYATELGEFTPHYPNQFFPPRFCFATLLSFSINVSSGFPNRIAYVFMITPVHAKSPANFVLLGFVVAIMFVEE